MFSHPYGFDNSDRNMSKTVCIGGLNAVKNNNISNNINISPRKRGIRGELSRRRSRKITVQYQRKQLIKLISRLLLGHIISGQNIRPPTESALIFREHYYAKRRWAIYRNSGFSSTIPCMSYTLQEKPFATKVIIYIIYIFIYIYYRCLI